MESNRLTIGYTNTLGRNLGRISFSVMRRMIKDQHAAQYRIAYCPLSLTLCTGKRKCMTPTVFREDGYRFFFFSREEERMHVHVVSSDGEAKFWLEPEIELAKNYNYSRKQLKTIESLVETHHNELISAWQQHFKS